MKLSPVTAEAEIRDATQEGDEKETLHLLIRIEYNYLGHRHAEERFVSSHETYQSAVNAAWHFFRTRLGPD